MIGAGSLGRRLAMLACQAGFITTLEDVLPANLRTARSEIAGPLHTLLRFASTVAEAVRDADLVLDSLPDELESKLEIFSMVDRMAPPHTVMMTPTRTHSIADLASCTYRADRCFSFEVPDHFAAACGSLRLVETRESDASARHAVVEFWQRAGWQPALEIDAAQTPLPTIR